MVNLPDSFACDRGTTNSRNLTLQFQYEFAVTDPEEDIGAEVIVQTLPAFEYYILYYVAEAVGVLNCEIGKQDILGSTAVADAPQVVGISNVKPDQWESNVSCTALNELEPHLVCVPLQGFMMAHFVGLDENQGAVEDWLAQNIEKVIDGPEVIRNGVERAKFVSFRVVSSSPPSVGSTENPNSTSRSRSSVVPATLGGGAAMGLVIGLISVMLLVRQRRRRSLNQRSEVIPEIPTNNKAVVIPPGAETSHTDEDGGDNDQENPEIRKDIPDAEVPSVDQAPHLQSFSTTRTASETIDGSASPPGMVTVDTREEAVNPEDPPSEINIRPRADSSSPGSSKPPIPMVPKPPSSPTTVNSKPPPAPKPPVRTPTPPPGTLKKKRRKKKKKKRKKPPMVRVNSREKIKEMETIAEAAEEEIPDNSSDYSWYSTSDSCCSSRDVSPARFEDLDDVQRPPMEDDDDAEQPSNPGSRSSSGDEEKVAAVENSDDGSDPPRTISPSSSVPSATASVEEPTLDMNTTAVNEHEDEVATIGDGSATTTSKATNDDTEGSNEPPIPTHWV